MRPEGLSLTHIFWGAEQGRFFVAVSDLFSTTLKLQRLLMRLSPISINLAFAWFTDLWVIDRRKRRGLLSQLLDKIFALIAGTLCEIISPKGFIEEKYHYVLQRTEKAEKLF